MSAMACFQQLTRSALQSNTNADMGSLVAGFYWSGTRHFVSGSGDSGCRSHWGPQLAGGSEILAHPRDSPRDSRALACLCSSRRTF
jgi:hypothetical protein